LSVNGNGSEKQEYSGPQSRWRELRFTFRIIGEFIQGFRALHFVGRDGLLALLGKDGHKPIAVPAAKKTKKKN